MTGDDENKPAPDDARTVFMPSTASVPPIPVQPADPAEPALPPPADGDGGKDVPAAEAAAPAETPPPAASVPPASTPSAAPGYSARPGTTFPPIAPGEEGRRIQIGDVLNHIFEVRRFIARGGMGEVFEGINVNSDERVAIKVILPHLAADASVQAMFRKEARTLTKLSHPGLVQYRVLAQEPQLGAFYIVTEYIDGSNLSDVLKTLKPTPAQLTGLMKRMAEGLAAAHGLGAIHRDISPDNVMFEQGKIDYAKIIDFGIAKDLNASAATIVGDGFAGKLNYVAPEQLGDFDRAVGPWTDVYSLGLTILAAAQGKDVDMGGSLVDAVDKRRAGVDVSAAPESLRPVLAAMLKANPAERLRSMDNVLEMLAGKGASAKAEPAAKGKPEKPVKATKVQPAGGASAQPKAGGAPSKKLALIGGGVAALVAAGAALTFAMGGDDGGGKKVAGGKPAGGTVAAAPLTGDPVMVARKTLETALPTIPCSWLDIADLSADGTKVSLALRGVSGKSPEALDQVQKLLLGAGLQAASIEMGDVSPISATTCQAIESFVQIRAGGEGRLGVAQRKFEMNSLPADSGSDAGKPGAEAVFTLNLAGFTENLSLVGLDETGMMEQMAADKSDISLHSEIVGNQLYRFSFITTHSGWSGILMLTGKGPFDASLLTNNATTRGANWAQNFLKLAKERGWKSEMVWYRTVDELPNAK